MEATITLCDLCAAGGRYDDAIALGETLVALLENEVGLDRLLLALALTRLADLHYLAKRQDAARPLLVRAAKVADGVVKESALGRDEIEKLLGDAGPEGLLHLSEARERLRRDRPRPFRDLLEAPLRYDFAFGVVEAAEVAAEALKALGEHCWETRRRTSAVFVFVRLMQLLDSPLQFDAPVVIKNIFTFVDEAKAPKSRVAALELARFGLQLADREWGSTSDRVLPALERVLAIEDQLRHHKAAQTLLKRCREIVRGAWANAEDPSVMERLLDIARFLLWRGELDLAGEIAQRGLHAALEEASWLEEPGIMNWLDLAVDVLIRAEQPEQAETLASDILARGEELLGLGDPQLLRGFDALASARQAQGNLRAALVPRERAVDLAIQAWGADDPRIAPWMRSLANLQYDVGEFGAAETLAERVLFLAESDDAAKKGNLAFRGAVRFKLGRFAEAGNDWEESMQRSGSAKSATTMFNLAAVYRISGDHGKADELLQSALEIERARYGPDSPKLGPTLRGLGELRVAENKLEEAESLYAQSLALWKDKQETGHQEVSRVLCRQGALFSLLGRHEEAQKAFSRAVAMSEAILGEDHAQVGECLIAAAEALRRDRRPALAVPLLSRALAIYERKLGTDVPRSVACRSLLAEFQGRGGCSTSGDLRRSPPVPSRWCQPFD